MAVYTHLNLPVEIEQEFDLHSIAEDTKFPAKEVAKKIFERADGFKKVLEPLLQPEHVIEMEEAGKLTEKQLQHVSTVLQQLMRLDRELLVAELENTEAAYMTFINIAWQHWPRIKSQLQPLVLALRDGWTTQKKLNVPQHYLG